MRNVAFQVRQAYWKSKARLLIEWLLKRLGIFVREQTTNIRDGVSLVFLLMPLAIFLFLLYGVFVYMGVLHG